MTRRHKHMKTVFKPVNGSRTTRLKPSRVRLTVPRLPRRPRGAISRPETAPRRRTPLSIAAQNEPAQLIRPEPPTGDALQLYLREIGQVKLLTPQEEIALARRIKRGDKRAREHMIKANLRLVVKIARD